MPPAMCIKMARKYAYQICRLTTISHSPHWNTWNRNISLCWHSTIIDWTISWCTNMASTIILWVKQANWNLEYSLSLCLSHMSDSVLWPQTLFHFHFFIQILATMSIWWEPLIISASHIHRYLCWRSRMKLTRQNFAMNLICRRIVLDDLNVPAYIASK